MPVYMMHGERIPIINRQNQFSRKIDGCNRRALMRESERVMIYMFGPTYRQYTTTTTTTLLNNTCQEKESRAQHSGRLPRLVRPWEKLPSCVLDGRDDLSGQPTRGSRQPTPPLGRSSSDVSKPPGILIWQWHKQASNIVLVLQIVGWVDF